MSLSKLYCLISGIFARLRTFGKRHPPLDDEQKKRILRALEREDTEDVDAIKELQSPAELHQFMLHYNWDDGIAAVREIVAHPLCDYGTALLTYWISGPCVCGYSSREDCPEYFLSHYDCIADLEDRLLSDSYRNHTIFIDPRNLFYLGNDWLNPRTPLKRSPPKRLTCRSPGIPMARSDL